VLICQGISAMASVSELKISLHFLSVHNIIEFIIKGFKKNIKKIKTGKKNAYY
jgi:hypothetical protein